MNVRGRAFFPPPPVLYFTHSLYISFLQFYKGSSTRYVYIAFSSYLHYSPIILRILLHSFDDENHLEPLSWSPKKVLISAFRESLARGARRLLEPEIPEGLEVEDARVRLYEF